MSNTKSIINELCTLETESAAIIPKDYYYALKIKTASPKTISLKEIAENLLLTDPAPSSIYYSKDSLFIIFPAAQEAEDESIVITHQLEGNHNLIVSKYCMMLSKLLPNSDISVQIVHLPSKTKVFSYMSYIVFAEYQNTIIKLSQGDITPKELKFRTDNELKHILLTKKGLNMDNIPTEQKYGVFMRVKRTKNKVSYLTMSEPFDARDTKKYISFMLG